MATSPALDVTFAGDDLALRLPTPAYLARFSAVSRIHTKSELRLYFYCAATTNSPTRGAGLQTGRIRTRPTSPSMTPGGRRPSRLTCCASVRQPMQLVCQGFGDSADAAV